MKEKYLGIFLDEKTFNYFNFMYAGTEAHDKLNKTIDFFIEQFEIPEKSLAVPRPCPEICVMYIINGYNPITNEILGSYTSFEEPSFLAHEVGHWILHSASKDPIIRNYRRDISYDLAMINLQECFAIYSQIIYEKGRIIQIPPEKPLTKEYFAAYYAAGDLWKKKKEKAFLKLLNSDFEEAINFLSKNTSWPEKMKTVLEK